MTRRALRIIFLRVQPEDQRFTHRGVCWPAVHPRDGSSFEVLIPHRRIQWARKMGVGGIQELHHGVRAVLARPSAVFQGLQRDEDDSRDGTEGWLCYSADPGMRYNYSDGRRIPYRDRVLLVFVNGEREVYTHRWEAEDPNEPGLPADRHDPPRFRSRLI